MYGALSSFPTEVRLRAPASATPSTAAAVGTPFLMSYALYTQYGVGGVLAT